jgi:oligopeptide/dipeptide ABC transporter ATP-binding protein
MCQRVVLAIAMALRPKILIADEPTSDLDLTVQAQILNRLKRLNQEYGTSILLITHDWGIVATMAQYVVVLYAGWTVERAPVRATFDRPLFPYTESLLETFQVLGGQYARLPPLKDMPVNLREVQHHCPYLPRCPKAINTCRLELKPPLKELEQDHWVACYNPVTYG